VTFNAHGDLRIERLCPTRRIPRRCAFHLLALRIDFLVEVACSAHQSDSNESQIQIGSRTERVTRKDAETARVGVHLRAQSHFHRKAGDARLARELVKLVSHIGHILPRHGHVLDA
jgi:hypothetical protein